MSKNFFNTEADEGGKHLKTDEEKKGTEENSSVTANEMSGW